MRSALQLRHHFLGHDLESDVIGDNVMRLQQRIPMPTRILCNLQAHERRMSQIHFLPARIHPIAQLRFNISIADQRDFRHRQLGTATDHLHGLRQLFPKHRSAQRVVSIDDALQASREFIQLRCQAARWIGATYVHVS